MPDLGVFDVPRDLLLIRLLLHLTNTDPPLLWVRRHLPALADPDLGRQGPILTRLNGLKLPQYMSALHRLPED